MEVSFFHIYRQSFPFVFVFEEFVSEKDPVRGANADIHKASLCSCDSHNTFFKPRRSLLETCVDVGPIPSTRSRCLDDGAPRPNGKGILWNFTDRFAGRGLFHFGLWTMGPRLFQLAANFLVSMTRTVKTGAKQIFNRNCGVYPSPLSRCVMDTLIAS